MVLIRLRSGSGPVALTTSTPTPNPSAAAGMHAINANTTITMFALGANGNPAAVRALGGACDGIVPQSADRDADAARAAIGAATRSLAAHDVPTAYLMIAAARSTLGRIDERFAVVSAIDGRLTARDTELRQVQTLTATDPAAAIAALERWTIRFGRDVLALRKAESQSLYASATLETALMATGRH